MRKPTPTKQRLVRQAQTVMPFGPGNLMDILGESLVACDTGYWPAGAPMIEEPRLARALGVDSFRSAPPKTEKPGPGRSIGVPYFRFPGWLFCPACRKLVQTAARPAEGEVEMQPRCSTCERYPKLVPVRFVCACEDGHLDDMPWIAWAHSQPLSADQRQCQSQRLLLRSVRGGGSGLDALVVTCSTCGAERSLQGVTRKDSLTAIGRGANRCGGRQPWQPRHEAENCLRVPQVLQRGASNLYFNNWASAIDIPPYSDYEIYSGVTRRIAANKYFKLLVDATEGPLEEMYVPIIAKESAASVEEVRRALRAHRDEIGSQHEPGPSDLKGEEWNALVLSRNQQDMRSRFVTHHTVLLASEADRRIHSLRLLDSLVEHVVIVRRLREVRALRGFSRIRDDGRMIPASGRNVTNWLPAVEVYGEGIFLTLKEAALVPWEQQVDVRKLAESLESRRLRSHLRGRLEMATPRFLLLHSLAHALIRQLAFECGYSAASIKERIYAREPTTKAACAGVLIYTAAGDSEGTLGGLARQGEASRLARSVLSALDRASWCSLDPICREGHAQGFDGLNRAACHACTLVPETSCEYANALLSRDLLIGENGLGEMSGFFAGVLAAMREDVMQTS